MSRAYWACVGLMVVGLVLFLVGANYYNAAVGFAGEYVFIFGIIAALAVYVYSELKKTRN
jgi:membrane-bound ClpP family serine protease